MEQVGLREIQEELARFRDARDWSEFHSPKNLAAAIAVEAARLQELFLWRSEDENHEAVQREVEQELADVLLQALNFANAADIDAGAAIRPRLRSTPSDTR